jgi:hypothetical protein
VFRPCAPAPLSRSTFRRLAENLSVEQNSALPDTRRRPQSERIRRAARILFTAGAITVGLSLADRQLAARFTVNVTTSMPRGIYRLRPDRRAALHSTVTLTVQPWASWPCPSPGPRASAAPPTTFLTAAPTSRSPPRCSPSTSTYAPSRLTITALKNTRLAGADSSSHHPPCATASFAALKSTSTSPAYPKTSFPKPPNWTPRPPTQTSTLQRLAAPSFLTTPTPLGFTNRSTGAARDCFSLLPSQSRQRRRPPLHGPPQQPSTPPTDRAPAAAPPAPARRRQLP